MKPTKRIRKNDQKSVRNETNVEIPPINEHIGDKELKSTKEDMPVNNSDNRRLKNNTKIYTGYFVLEIILEIIVVLFISSQLLLEKENIWNSIFMYVFYIAFVLITSILKILLKFKVWAKKLHVFYILFLIATICVEIHIILQYIPGFQKLPIKN